MNDNISQKIEENLESGSSTRNYKKIIVVVSIVVLVIIGVKFGFVYFYTHDSHATVSSGLTFDDDFETITISSFDFDIPSNVIVGKGSDYLTMEDSNREYVVRIDIMDGQFQKFFENSSNLKNDSFLYNGKSETKKYGGKDYIVVDTANWFFKTLFAMTEASEDKILVISIINKKNTYDYELLEKYSEVVNSVREHS